MENAETKNWRWAGEVKAADRLSSPEADANEYLESIGGQSNFTELSMTDLMENSDITINAVIPEEDTGEHGENTVSGPTLEDIINAATIDNHQAALDAIALLDNPITKEAHAGQLAKKLGVNKTTIFKQLDVIH